MIPPAPLQAPTSTESTTTHRPSLSRRCPPPAHPTASTIPRRPGRSSASLPMHSNRPHPVTQPSRASPGGSLLRLEQPEAPPTHPPAITRRPSENPRFPSEHLSLFRPLHPAHHRTGSANPAASGTTPSPSTPSPATKPTPLAAPAPGLPWHSLKPLRPFASAEPPATPSDPRLPPGPQACPDPFTGHRANHRSPNRQLRPPLTQAQDPPPPPPPSQPSPTKPTAQTPPGAGPKPSPLHPTEPTPLTEPANPRLPLAATSSLFGPFTSC
jgi:hypothetical protein